MTCGAILPLNKDPDEGTLHPHYQCRSPASVALLIFANLVGKTPALPSSVISVCGAPATAPTLPPAPRLRHLDLELRVLGVGVGEGLGAPPAPTLRKGCA